MTIDLKPGPINLDEIDSAELYAFVDATKGSGRRRTARRMFKGEKLSVQAVDSLHNYAYAKATAIAHRMRGDIKTAMHYESNCYRIYNDLPEYARW